MADPKNCDDSSLLTLEGQIAQDVTGEDAPIAKSLLSGTVTKKPENIFDEAQNMLYLRLSTN